MRKKRYITDAALMTAITCIFLIINRLMMNFFDEFLIIFFPLPISIYVMMHGKKNGLILLFAIPITSLLIADPLRAICFIVPTVLAGYIYGIVYLRGWDEKFGLLIKIIITILINILTSVVLANVLFGISIVEEAAIMGKDVVNFLSALHFSKNSLVIVESLVIAIIPTIIFITSCLEAFMVHLLAKYLRKHLLKTSEEEMDFFRIKIPKILTYTAILLTFVSLSTLPYFINEGTWVKTIHIIGINLSLITMVAFIFEGLVFISVYSRRKKKPYLYLLAIMLIFTFPLFLVVVGIFDSLSIKSIN